MVFKNLCILVLWTKVALALKGLRGLLQKFAPCPKNFNIRACVATTFCLNSYQENVMDSSWGANIILWAT